VRSTSTSGSSKKADFFYGFAHGEVEDFFINLRMHVSSAQTWWTN